MNTNDHLDTLTEIRDLMNRSSRFMSLSGLGGIWVGVTALLGAAAAKWKIEEVVTDYGHYYEKATRTTYDELLYFLLADALVVLLVAVAGNYYFTVRRAKKHGQSVWTPAALRVGVNLAIPLAAGGLFGLAMLYHGYLNLVAPATLVFYGLGVINASKYTLGSVRWLGLAEVVLGLVSAFIIGYDLLFWTLGFGVAHIIYGVAMWHLYERN
ncbi:MAG: hypothetical protein MUC97_06430 [Bernardetiaceae bacterium]|jgi:hypothetical protein|nr:hypothetical protein [Bernardetiaceae bacterium]